MHQLSAKNKHISNVLNGTLKVCKDLSSFSTRNNALNISLPSRVGETGEKV